MDCLLICEALWCLEGFALCQTILKAALAQAGKSLSKIVEEAKQASGRKQMLEERKTVIAEKEAA